ncbi:MAG: four helix bundle protein [Planctomycetota bacterium]
MAFLPVEELEVYQLAEKVADEVWKVVKRWEHFERNTIGSQLVRAADSVGANIAEGAGRGAGADQRRFLRIARGSLVETRFWLRRGCRRGLISKDEADAIHRCFSELSPKLNSYLNSIPSKHKTPNTKHSAT